MVDKRPSDRQTYTRKAGMLFAGLFLLAGSCLTTAARSDDSTRIPGQVLQNGGAPFTDTVRQMVLRDEQFRRDVIAGLRPAPDPTVGVTRYRWRSKGTQADGAVFQAVPRVEHNGARSLLGSPVNAPQGLGTNFAGISQQDQIDEFGGAGFAPPDTMGAVGPNHFVTMLRGSVAIYDKSGSRLSHVTLNSFFTVGSYPRGNTYSPRVIFDRRSGRWFAVALETNGGAANHAILAVSATSDPTGTWRKYAITIGESNTTTDEVMIGTDDNGVYFGASMIPSGGSPFGKVAATRKASLLAASPSLSTVYTWRLITDMMATPVPTHNQDAVASNGFAYLFASSTVAYANIRYRTLQWALSGVPTLSLTVEIPSAAYGPPVDAPAKDSTTDIDVGDDRVLMAVQRANGIWGTRNVGVTSSGGAGAVDRTAVEWFRIDASIPGALALADQGRVFDQSAEDPMFYYYGSIVVSGQGHAAVGFSGSNTANYVGAYTCGRLASTPAGTMLGVMQIKDGLAGYDQLIGGRNRWGNYSATTLDPNDDMSIWTIQEYADSTDDNPANVWGTWIARLLAPAPTITNAAGSAVQGVSGKVLNITGTGFFDPGTGYPNHIDVQLSGDEISNYVITYNSPTSVTAKFDIGLDATIGMRDVTVINPDGQSATAAGAFEIIRAIPTTLVADDVAGVIGEVVNLTATLTNDDTSAGIPGKTITFKVDGNVVGTAVTDANGVATLPVQIPEGFGAGEHEILAAFAFDGTYRPSEDTATATVSKAGTTAVADDKTAKIGATVGLTATLTRNHDSAPIVGRTVGFSVDGTGVGNGVTNASGVAGTNYVVPEGPGVGTRTITAAFAGDGDYNPSTDDATLTVEKGNTALAVPAVVGTVGTTVDLSATLTVVGAGLPLAGKTVEIKVDGTSVGTDDTDASGVATVAYLIPDGTAVGDHAIGAEFAGDANYEAGSGSGTLNVDVNTTIVADDQSGMMGQTVVLSATLTRSDNSDPVAGKTVDF
ncbi:MAG: Ig-like domain repeat protein [Chthonomonadales bacterium]|nr:Ig-like domain repeat protein [Chthonomonadales bacterium]